MLLPDLPKRMANLDRVTARSIISDVVEAGADRPDLLVGWFMAMLDDAHAYAMEVGDDSFYKGLQRGRSE